PSGTYRGPSQYEATFFRERMIDRAARELGADPAELRRSNLVPVTAMPFRVDLGEGNDPILYDAGDFGAVLDTLLARGEYTRVAEEAKRRRAAGDAVGVGVAAHVEEGAFGRYEYARIVAAGDRRYVLYVGVASLGQGVRTALAQIAADELKVPFEWLEVVHQDTDLVPQGFGAYASRTTVVGGGAVIGAAAELRRNALDAAAERLEIAASDLELLPGGLVRPRGQPSGGVTVAELRCEGAFRYEHPAPTFDMGATMALVGVDPDTAAVSLQRLVVCQDVGRMVNPQLVDGQFVGGAAQGVAGTLLERFAYDESGQPLVTSFMDYLMPTSVEVPPIDTVALELPHHDPATAHPLGVKGSGEAGVVSTGAAIANAVADALGGAEHRLTTLPLRPEMLRRKPYVIRSAF
ncbi:MAG: xanthine dehydrogenase family protein molybdopterin-binding subunit, partial [Solirubrobacteraceae bacterium]